MYTQPTVKCTHARVQVDVHTGAYIYVHAYIQTCISKNMYICIMSYHTRAYAVHRQTCAHTCMHINTCTFTYTRSSARGSTTHPCSHYNTLPCTATHCNTLQHTATRCNTHRRSFRKRCTGRGSTTRRSADLGVPRAAPLNLPVALLVRPSINAWPWLPISHTYVHAYIHTCIHIDMHAHLDTIRHFHK